MSRTNVEHARGSVHVPRCVAMNETNSPHLFHIRIGCHSFIAASSVEIKSVYGNGMCAHGKFGSVYSSHISFCPAYLFIFSNFVYVSRKSQFTSFLALHLIHIPISIYLNHTRKIRPTTKVSFQWTICVNCTHDLYFTLFFLLQPLLACFPSNVRKWYWIKEILFNIPNTEIKSKRGEVCEWKPMSYEFCSGFDGKKSEPKKRAGLL